MMIMIHDERTPILGLFIQYRFLIEVKVKVRTLINIVRKRKRFSKWNKPELVNDVEVIKEYYGYSNDKARQVLPLLTSDQVKTLREKVSKGGKRK
jgi:hypothetical protein